MKREKPDVPKKGGLKAWMIILPTAALLLALTAAAFAILMYQLSAMELTLNSSPLKKDKNFGFYYVPEDFKGFSGEVIGKQFLVKDVRYSVENPDGGIAEEGSLELLDGHFQIKKPGMFLGSNVLRVRVDCRLGVRKEATLEFVNDQETAFLNSKPDFKDADKDGLIGYVEEMVGTDPQNPDTDGDGLTDYEEYALTGTDPLKASTGNDGVTDSERDSDGDGLGNRADIDLGTDPACYDTDGDGLSDGEEQKQYGTQPLEIDTDGDLASDGWEVSHGTDPLAADEQFESETRTVGPSGFGATAAVRGSGRPESLSIEPAVIPGLLDESMDGYIGNAFEFSYSGDMEKAVIGFEFDPQEAAGSDLVVCWFDEETQQLVPISTDIRDNMAYAYVTHFSKYILLDRNLVDDVIQDDILSADDIEEIQISIAFVIDRSPSMDDNDPEYLRIKIGQTYVEKMRNGKDQAAVVHFSGSADTLVSLTSDLEMCKNAMGDIRNDSGDGCGGGGGTNGSAGIRNGLDELKNAAKDSEKYLIFLTDGEDTETSYDYGELEKEAVSMGVTIFTIGLGEANEELLKSVAEATGGRYYHASATDFETDGTASLEEVFEDIEGETIDLITDTNADGITDYHTRLICDGKIRTGTGSNPFGDRSFEEIQASSDLDGDGLKNGDEVEIVQTEDLIYLYYHSSPILNDTDGDGYYDNEDARRLAWDVGDRDLAVFSSLAYENGEPFVGRMYTAADLQGDRSSDAADLEHTEYYYFQDFGSIAEGGQDHGIAEHFVITDFTDTPVLIDKFSMTVFKSGDSVVLAYRGTNEDLEWVDDILMYGMCNYHSQEAIAESYARKVAFNFPECKVYITGHSLGGYLAQIGAAEMIEWGKEPERVAYFNGIGMNFTDHSGITNYITRGIFKPAQMMGKILHVDETAVLMDYANRTGNLIAYSIAGDWVSSFGTQLGKWVKFEAAPQSITYHTTDGNQRKVYSGSEKALGTLATSLLSAISREEVINYYLQYGVGNFIDYTWITHETDSFFYHLSQGWRSGR